LKRIAKAASAIAKVIPKAANCHMNRFSKVNEKSIVYLSSCQKPIHVATSSFWKLLVLNDCTSAFKKNQQKLDSFFM
jgi:hypothetical protein